jgi:tetratricopeptide (TPR) repeat protein
MKPSKYLYCKLQYCILGFRDTSLYFILPLLFVLSGCQSSTSSEEQPEQKVSYIDSTNPYVDSLKANFYFDTAVILRGKKNYDLSTTYFDLAIRSKYKDTHRALFLTGNNYYDAKKYESAMTYYNQAVLFNPNKDFWCFHNRALTAYYLGLPATTVCANVDSALAYGDTTNIAVLCDEAKSR